ncbi:unnamed protein product [Paramecium primaurelia]|uniref:Uncharacterized protein n=1 Tax=Paramecium primaurelia TaxID=5886 RepID=A0A8S1LIQ9_PARPR|nr:unnamed protein product [Paramecium primaurelia]
MNDYYILLYGSLSGFIAEIVGNLSNYWKYMGHYHSANPFLCSNGMFNNLDQKRMQQFKFAIDLYNRDCLMIWSSKNQQINCYMMESGTPQHGVQDCIQKKGSIKISSKKNQIKNISQGIQKINKVNFYNLSYLEALHNFAAQPYFKQEIFLRAKQLLVSKVSTSELFNLVHYLEKQNFFTVQIYLIAQFSSIIACFSDSLFYYFINKSSRFYFFYGERILVSKNGLALFLFDWLSLRDEKA